MQQDTPKEPPDFDPPQCRTPFQPPSGQQKTPAKAGVFRIDHRDEEFLVLGRPGSDLLFQVLRLSTIGAEEFNGRVRDGIGFRPLAKTTRPAKDEMKQSASASRAPPRRRGPRSAKLMVCSVQDAISKPRPSRRAASPRSSGGGYSPWTLSNESNQDNRAISTGKLNALPHLHTRPINVVVYHGSQGRTRFEVGFSLRCLQRLSRPHIATQHCRWRDNCSTRGASIPVLSY